MINGNQLGMGPQVGTFEQAQPKPDETNELFRSRAILKCTGAGGNGEAAIINTLCHPHWADNVVDTQTGTSYQVDSSGDWTLTVFKENGTQEVRDIRARICNIMQQNIPT